jgi:isocitrate dehydrogenase
MRQKPTTFLDLSIDSLQKSIVAKKDIYHLARLMEGASQVSCSRFGDVMIENMRICKKASI